VNAYASGLGATKRVVVWDTSVMRMTEEEILFVFGHEMGHYVWATCATEFYFPAASC